MGKLMLKETSKRKYGVIWISAGSSCTSISPFMLSTYFHYREMRVWFLNLRKIEIHHNSTKFPFKDDLRIQIVILHCYTYITIHSYVSGLKGCTMKPHETQPLIHPQPLAKIIQVATLGSQGFEILGLKGLHLCNEGEQRQWVDWWLINTYIYTLIYQY